MKVRTGKSGRPRNVRDDPRFAALVAEVDALDAEVLAAVRAHATAPTQAATVRLLEAQLRVAAMRAHLARSCGDEDAARRETELAVKLSKSRDDACKLLWGDELQALHEAVVRTGGVASEIAAELDGELDEAP